MYTFRSWAARVRPNIHVYTTHKCEWLSTSHHNQTVLLFDGAILIPFFLSSNLHHVQNKLPVCGTLSLAVFLRWIESIKWTTTKKILICLTTARSKLNCMPNKRKDKQANKHQAKIEANEYEKNFQANKKKSIKFVYHLPKKVKENLQMTYEKRARRGKEYSSTTKQQKITGTNRNSIRKMAFSQTTATAATRAHSYTSSISATRKRENHYLVHQMMSIFFVPKSIRIRKISNLFFLLCRLSFSLSLSSLSVYI